MERTIELLSATIERFSHSALLVRIRHEVKLTTEVIRNVMHACSGTAFEPRAVVVTIPEHTDFTAAALAEDHSEALTEASKVKALVIVCHEDGLLHLIRLYFAFYPPSIEVKYCNSLQEAGAWIERK